MDLKKHSKRLSLILRHKPEAANIALGEEGWVTVDELLAGMDSVNWGITRDQLIEIVATNDKKRFSLSEDGMRIRAAQGHSVAVDINLPPLAPPAQLFHGTATRFLAVILTEGLKPMSRQHVHLSADTETATKVGQRHGKPVILTIASGQMHQQGQAFYQADNSVWLTGSINPKYLSQS